MTLCATSIEFEFNSTNGLKFQLKRNWMHIGEEGIENFLMNMMLKEKELLRRNQTKKTSFHVFLLGNGFKNSNLELSK